MAAIVESEKPKKEFYPPIEWEKLLAAHPELFLPVDLDEENDSEMKEDEDSDNEDNKENQKDLGKFQKAIELVFDLQEADLVEAAIDKDICWRPYRTLRARHKGSNCQYDDARVNHFQWLNCICDQRDVLPDMLSYLFRRGDYYWDDRWDFDEDEKKHTRSSMSISEQTTRARRPISSA